MRTDAPIPVRRRSHGRCSILSNSPSVCRVGLPGHVVLVDPEAVSQAVSAPTSILAARERALGGRPARLSTDVTWSGSPHRSGGQAARSSLPGHEVDLSDIFLGRISSVVCLSNCRAR